MKGKAEEKTAREIELERELLYLRERSSDLEEKVELLEEQIDSLLQRLYGRRSERFEDPNQRLFFEDLLKAERKNPLPENSERIEYERKKPQKRGPKPLPEHLRREDVFLEPEEGERVCACCKSEMERVSEAVSEELTVKPPEFYVRRYIRGRWTCKSCMTQTIEKPLAARPIERGRPSPTLLAYLIVAKWADHQPLYRQEQIFKRYGIQLSRSTMDEWLGKIAELLRPIVEAMKKRLLERRFLQSDDTRIEVQDRKVEGKPKSRRCYLWAYSYPRGEIVYHFTRSRSAKGPLGFIEGFEGYLQSDGYRGYNEAFNKRRVDHIACMAHIRRKFFEAKKADPDRVERILELIKLLYAIESLAREENLPKEARLRLREAKAPEILEKIESEIEELAPLVTPKSKLGKAVTYARGQWPAMLRYLECAEAELDNNWCENALRPVVIGRKNFLFLGSAEGGARRAEVFFSLVQTCRRIEVNPFTYLADILERISTHPQSRLDELTPTVWKSLRESSEKELVRAAR